MNKKAKSGILIAAIVLAFALLCGSVWMLLQLNSQKASNKANVDWYDENGKEFVITTVDELYGLVALSDFYDFEGQTIKLGADIVVNEGNAENWAKNAPDRKWYPITDFAGTFDGQGHTISGIYGKSTDSAMGLFSGTKRNCVIQNLRLVNSYFSGADQGTGSITSHGGGKFDTIYCDAIIKTNRSYAGGLVGQLNISGEHKITNCWFDGAVTMKTEEGIYGGGIVGAISGDGGIVTIEHTLNTGSISAEGSSRAVDIGGFCGSTDKGAVLYVTDCLNAGIVQAKYDKLVGALIGDIKSGSRMTASHMYSIQESYIKTIGYQAGAVKGTPIVYSQELITGIGGYQWTTLDFDKYWAIDRESTPVLKTFADEIPSVEGIIKCYDDAWYNEFGTEFTISTLKEFYGFYILSANDNFEGKTVKLGADLVVNEGDASKWGEKAPENPWYPINSYAGIFDGQGYTISGLYVKGNNQRMGMFAETTSGASVQNVKLTNSYFEFTDTTMALLGSIAGRGNGNFDTIYSDAILVCSGTGCGGIVGQVTVAGAQISNCWFDGEIQMKGETGRQIGGILGITRAEADIDHCLNTSKITVETKGGIRAAGILGIATGGEFTIRITDCLTAGRIYAANSRIGAAVGEIQEGKTAIIRDVYAISETLSADEGKTFINKAIGHIASEVAATEKTDAIPAAITDGSAVMIPEAGITGYLGYQWTTLNFEKFWSVNTKGTPILTAFAETSPKVAGVKKKIDISWYDKDAKSYTIKTPEQLNGFFIVSALTDFEGKTVKLGKNISVNSGNAADWATNRPTDMWYPINTFAGTFDGRGHTISGLYLKSATQKIGFFGETTTKAVVKNFKLTNSYMESTSTGMALLGSIAGRGDGTFDTIYSDAIIVCSGTGCGGIVGQVYTVGNNKITNCWYDGTMSLKTDMGKQAGGILGISRVGVTIEHCLNTSDIKVEATGGLRVAGILGIMTGGEPYTVTIGDCLSAGNITTANSRVGAVVAEVQADKKLVLKDTYALAEGMTTGEDYIKKVIGHIDPKGTIKGVAALIPTDLLKGTNAGQWTTLDFGKYWGAKADSTPELVSFTTSENINVAGLPKKSDISWYDMSKNEFVIDSVEDLYGFYIMSVATNFKDQTVKLGADIDVNTGDAADWATKAPANVWYPVSTLGGTFDGQGHRISGLYLKSSDQMIGFFSYTAASATVKNLKITNSYMESTSTGMALLGSIVGRGNGTFDTVYSNAILVSSGTGNGGLIGQTYYKDTKISNAWFDGNITLTTEKGVQVGGIVGIARASIAFDNCLNTGAITVEHNAGIRAAGILGIMTGDKFEVTMDNCLTTGQITAANARVGVVIGEVQEGKTLTLNEVYATAESHYDGAKYITRPVGHSEGIIKGTGVIVPESSFTGSGAYLWTTFDFDKVWAAKANSTPELQSFTEGANLPVAGGMRADTSWYAKKDYNINTLAELYGLSKLSWTHDFKNITITLGKADVEETFTLNEGSATSWAAGVNLPENKWIPIGTEDNPFAGTFDGQKNIISGVYLTTVSKHGGLFTKLTGTVQNLNLTNSYFGFKGHKDGYIGSIVGSLCGTLNTVSSDAIVYSNGLYTGGLVGSADDTALLGNCWFKGTVTLEKDKCQYAAGLIGQVIPQGDSIVTIEHCLNTGTITGERSDTTILGLAGFCAYVYSGKLNIYDSVHTGTIEGTGTRRVYLVARGEGFVTCENTYYSNDQKLDHAVWGDKCGEGKGAKGYASSALKGMAAKISGVKLNEAYWALSEETTPQLKAFGATEGASVSLWTGEGTISSPWIIKDKAGLELLARLSSAYDFEGKYFSIGDDTQTGTLKITINESLTNATNWTPIGSSSKPFAGNFDGNRNEISGVYYSGANQMSGLFGKVSSKANIMNFKLTNSKFEYTGTGNAYLGSIAGYSEAYLEGIKSEATVISNGAYNGGIVGNQKGSGITECWYSGNMSLGTGGKFSGGIIGNIESTVAMNNCLYSGTLVGAGSGTGACYGGLCGQVYGSGTTLRINDSLTYGTVSAASGNWYGSIVGYIYTSATVYLKNTYTQTGVAGSNYAVRLRSGTIYYEGTPFTTSVGYKFTDYPKALSADAMKGDNASSMELDFQTYWSKVPNGRPVLKTFTSEAVIVKWAGNGTAESPWIITNHAELALLAKRARAIDYAGCYFQLGTDAQKGQLTITVNAGTLAEIEASTPTDWLPIGNKDVPFAGTFNGNGNTISGVYYSGTDQYVGLFGYVGTSGIIKNLKLTTSLFEYTGTGNAYLGTVVGYCAGTLEKIKSDASLESNGAYNGGIVGNKLGGTVTECWYSGTMTLGTGGKFSGGIIGNIESTVAMNNCLYSGTLVGAGSGTGACYGGLCGQVYGSGTTLRINDSLTYGTVSAASGNWYGSIVGYIYNSASVYLENTYTQTGVAGSNYAVRLRSGTIHYEGTPFTTSVGYKFTDYPKALSADAMKGDNASSMELDFQNYWNTVTDGKPVLKNCPN